MKKVIVTSRLPASAETIWPLLTKIETLRYIAAPLATFTPRTDDAIWQEGATLQFRLRLFGFLPMGMHTIHVRRFDASTHSVYTEETNRWVPVWNHTITLAPAPDGTTLYTDIVAIDAGPRSGLISLWSRWFYRHRQRRWHRLLQA